jgi:uncharacterized protein Yka (UPF0111/DUF47 family)
VLGMLSSAPRYDSFYALFERAGANVEQATALLATLMTDWPDDGARLRFELKELETQGDRITHDLIHHLNVRAATPFSVADAHMRLYRIEAPMEHAIELTGVLSRAGRELAAALGSLRRPQDMRAHLISIQELEHEGDRVEREALRSLFDGGIDPMVVIRWKDVYERLEEAIDACRHVANSLEGLIVKTA